MIPLVWVESAGLGADATDLYPDLRHTWQVAYRCPGCSTVSVERLPAQALVMDGSPAPLPPDEVRAAVTRLVAGHQCPHATEVTA